nr:MAG TPA: hypothetical protein [Myoviridae sp. ct5lt7]
MREENECLTISLSLAKLEEILIFIYYDDS